MAEITGLTVHLPMWRVRVVMWLICLPLPMRWREAMVDRLMPWVQRGMRVEAND